MTIRLPSQAEALIRQKVASGLYASADEAIATAVHLLDEHDRQLAALRAKLQVGIDEADRGETDEWTPELRERLRQEAHEMFRRGELPDEHDRRLATLREKVQAGIDQLDRGEGVLFTPKWSAERVRIMRERTAAGQTPHPDVCPWALGQARPRRAT